MECVDVCGPGAIVKQPEERERRLQGMRHNFRFLSKLPDSPARFIKDAL